MERERERERRRRKKKGGKEIKGGGGGGRAAPLIYCGLLFASVEHNNKRVVFKRIEEGK